MVMASKGQRLTHSAQRMHRSSSRIMAAPWDQPYDSSISGCSPSVLSWFTSTMWMTPSGQTSAHAPHSTHRNGSNQML